MGAHHLTNPCPHHVLTLMLATSLLLISLQLPPISASNVTQSYTDFIKTSCNSTTNPSLCFKSLSPYASSVQTNPEKLCNAALTVTLHAASNASKAVSKLAKQNGLTAHEAATVKDCIDDMKDSIDELKQSLEAMADLGSAANKEFQMANVKTWMSAAITDEDTCTDGLAEGKVSVAVKNNVRSIMRGVVQLTSNALSLINHLSY